MRTKAGKNHKNPKKILESKKPAAGLTKSRAANPLSNGDDHFAFDLPFPVVAIGASAGGLKALINLFGKLSPKSGMAFVIIQHSDPSSRSLLQNILSEHTSMPVLNAKDNVRLKENTVFIALPGDDVRLSRDKFRVKPALSRDIAHSQIDHFMTSLAETCPEKAVGIVLSGTGCDGAAGAKAIRDAGGITIAQEKRSAEYADMPCNAAPYANYILQPEPIAEKLQELKRYFKDKRCLDNSGLKEIFEILHKISGVDFTNYKRSTIMRRISRRMLFMNMPDVRAYIHLLAGRQRRGFPALPGYAHRSNKLFPRPADIRRA